MDSTTEIVINPVAYYAIGDAARMLGLSRERLAAEHHANRLRIAKRGHSTFVRGQWLIDWIEAAANETVTDGEVTT